VTTDDELAALAEHVRTEGCFAYDTEFITEQTYVPRICLVQVATPHRIAVVDPLAGLDLAPVWELVADPDLETIVHAGEQDLEPVVRLLDRAPANVFDTQIAAAFTERHHPLGLLPLVEDLVGVRLGKAHTFTQWDRRPLSAEHAAYAADDVRYLPAVRAALGERLAVNGHAAWAAEECATLCDPERYRFDADARAVRLMGRGRASARERAFLRALVVFRDEVARDRDLPPQTVLRNDVLVRVARSGVRRVEQLHAVKGLPAPFVDRHGDAIVELAEAARSAPAPAARGHHPPEESAAERFRLDGLWSLLCAYCHARSIAASLVTTRQELGVVWHARRRGVELPDTILRTRWRRELIGEFLDRFLDGRIELAMSWRDGRLEAEAREPGGPPATE
jgi:ribonuclease D